MYQSRQIVDRQTGLLLSTADVSYEAPQSEYALQHTWFIDITAVASLTDGLFYVQCYNPTTNTWIKAPQDVSLIAVTSGTPDVTNMNTASTTAVVNGRALNSNGITDIDDLATIIIMAPGMGVRMRLFTDVATSGTGTFSYTYIGLRPTP